jgi:hypothetical protein
MSGPSPAWEAKGGVKHLGVENGAGACVVQDNRGGVVRRALRWIGVLGKGFGWRLLFLLANSLRLGRQMCVVIGGREF